MALYAIGDTHLSLSSNKPMDVFGGGVGGLCGQAAEGAFAAVGPEDTVVLCGDLSWGMSLEEAKKDFAFLDALPGARKLLLKGNHDYWWNTAAKMNRFFAESGFSTLRILHNNCYEYGGYALCGTRGWLFDVGEPHDEKVMNREIGRLRMSLQAAEPGLEKLVFLHYPPVYTGTSAPGDRGHPEGVRHQDLLLRASARQRHPVRRTGRGGRHPVQAGKCRRPAFLPLPHQLTTVQKGKNDKI
mgnify:CR=1 FL=1